MDTWLSTVETQVGFNLIKTISYLVCRRCLGQDRFRVSECGDKLRSGEEDDGDQWQHLVRHREHDQDPQPRHQGDRGPGHTGH